MPTRTYREFILREAVFRICCSRFDAVVREITEQRLKLEAYIERHPEFKDSLHPLSLHDGAPPVARRMAAAAELVGVGPMAAVAGTMAQLAGEAGLAAGAPEVVIENGGDIFLAVTEPAVVGLYAGTAGVGDRLALRVEPEDTPLAVCSSSSHMGHSMSLGACDLATVVSASAALADAAATQAANLVTDPADLGPVAERMAAIKGVDGVLLAKADSVSVAGRLPSIIRHV